MAEQLICIKEPSHGWRVKAWRCSEQELIRLVFRLNFIQAGFHFGLFR